jgi:CheY-like chemotaxis protein/signal transduction histidine kinase/CHASE3 domain sensor protein
MNDTTLPFPIKSRKGIDFSIFLGLAAVMLFFVVSGAITYINTRALIQNVKQVIHTHEVITSVEQLLSLMKDAQNGQRGYLITGNEKYLEPYKDAISKIDKHINDLERLTANNPDQQFRIPAIKEHIAARLNGIKEAIATRREKGFDPALSEALTDRGEDEMEALRVQIGAMHQEEQQLRNKRLDEMNTAYNVAITSNILSGVFGAILSAVVAYMIRKALVARRQQEWLQSGYVGLSMAISGEQRVEQLGENILKFLGEYFGAYAAAFFVRNGVGYNRVATYGLSSDSKTPERFDLNDGLLGQAAKDRRTFLIPDIPEEHLTIGTAFSKGKPRHLLISPAISDGIVNAVLEMGFVHPVNEQFIKLLEKVSETISIAVRSANYRSNLQSLLEETQRQAEELQVQSEELRVTNEELEEQSRSLKASQSNLEQQQAELEQTNAQLEEQTQLLEAQRDDLEKTKKAVQHKAQELEQASRYKSDFLANMSHELRTPLNSSLILAKLLADNPHNNLTPEQVKYARTIQASGNDLLIMINDILDLSKIEAGHMEVIPEQVTITRLMSDMTRLFEPVCQQKGLVFGKHISEKCPTGINVDRQRLEQILKNLLSNAIKFTEHGKVEIAVNCEGSGFVTFTVSDTGIGISKEHQQMVFEAFRQADSTINRKYGGTGLGLSISRELARLLGGSISLESEPGKGSAFTVTIPEIYNPDAAKRNIAAGEEAPTDSVLLQHETEEPEKLKYLEDDRYRLTADRRRMLVIEDDESFARILYDLAQELGFQCLISTTASDALVLARQYLPNAIVLDVGLPDNSGLSVLDRLKRDPSTRHIPVHVISADDYTQAALSMGAVGYMIKPVKRQELAEALKKLEAKFSQQMRRILIVEDDSIQRDSMKKLLASHDVETTGVGTAAECLKKLKETTFDCMVLDLSLPDTSGYALLETLSLEDNCSFPPVIVYTGRDLSAKEEQKLRKYSKSIIIKGAKSPERLLDEVTLFLHQIVSELPPDQQKMLEKLRRRDEVLENRRILIVEDDVRNIYALTSIFEPNGAEILIARNGIEALDMLEKNIAEAGKPIDLVLMDMMMPEMDGLTATQEIRKRPEWKKLPVIMLTAKAMKDDQERCLKAGANDYMAKPLDVEKLLSLVRVWMPR